MRVRPLRRRPGEPGGPGWEGLVFHKEKNENGNYITSYEYTDYKSQEELDKNNIEGRYLGNALVIVIGTYDEKIGKNGTMLDDDAVAATFTIYGVNGKDDIKSYCGLTVSSDPTKFPMLLEGEYMATHQQMATSRYGKGSLTYIIKTMDGSTMLPPVGGYNIATKKNYMDRIFLHRTNLDGKATNASVGCLVIDGRSWQDVEKQLRKSKKIFISLTRNKEQP